MTIRSPGRGSGRSLTRISAVWVSDRIRADPNSVIRKAAAFEARYVRRKEVIQPLIDLLGDEEKFVAMSAVQSLWTLTRHEAEFHDWDASNKQDRQWLQWLLELRTLRGQAHRLETENRRLRADYETLLLQSRSQ